MLRINNDKAILIAQERIRAWRETEFAENDVRIQNALADGDEQARIEAVAYRDYLRDLPQQCEGKTVDELKALMIELGVIA
jgi:hypothetical protein